MRKIFFILLIISSFSAFSQKPSLDTSILGKFPYLDKPSISNDGKYVSYIINKQPLNSQTLVVQSTEGSWKKEFIGANAGFFSGNSKQYVFKSKDSLCFLTAGGTKIEYFPGLLSYMQPGYAGSYKGGDWLAYQVKDNKRLFLKNLLTGKEQQFDFVTEYAFEGNGKALVLKSTTENKNNELIWVNLSNNKTKVIWSSGNAKVSGYKFDKDVRQIVFSVQKIGNPPEIVSSNSIWYYREGMDKAVVRVDNHSAGIDKGSFISGNPSCNESGKYIFFTVKDSDPPKASPDAVKVNVWSYKDLELQPIQLTNLKSADEYYLSLPIDGGKLTRLNQLGEIAGLYVQKNEDVLIRHEFPGEYWWASNYGERWVVSVKNGQRKKLPYYFSPVESYSPKGQYLVYYDLSKQQYYSYEINTSVNKCISKNAGVSFGDRNHPRGLPGNPIRPPDGGIAGFLADESAVLVYDNYDVWQLDLKGLLPPVNLTNGYGYKQHLKFRLLDEFDRSKVNAIDAYKKNETLILTAFNELNKHSGYYQLQLGFKREPELLSMGPFAWGYKEGVGSKPIKALDADIWLLSRQSDTELPNYFLTSDFKKYQQITNLNPQANYNWLTTELISWKLPDGATNQGVLYKPENFDSTKKYPIIFTFYELRSDRRYFFKFPQFISVDMDIPWFVSHGYLIFTPDIHRQGYPGQTAYNSVVSAAQYLSKFPYVDVKHMGLQGHSFGGYETNYIVTRTALFAAASEGAGTSDMISSYSALRGKYGAETGHNQALSYESGQYRMGATLWQRPDLYVENSPIFKADKVTTPLLIMHNRKDPNVPWAQGVEWFTGLRRLQKKAWMLEYDDGIHGVDGKDAGDYTLRMTQFFDHYLKGVTAPIWMTKGIAAKDKGIITGYELDPDGWCGKDCVICKKLHEEKVVATNKIK